jgi:hypothetical protein
MKCIVNDRLQNFKTRMRSSLNQGLLEPPLLINIGSDIIPNIEEIIKCYAFRLQNYNNYFTI